MVINIEGTAANIYNSFLRIVKNAKLKPWNRLWHNLRASRDTELSEVLPAHAVAELMGNSVAISQKHYKMIMPQQFESLKAKDSAVENSSQKSGTKMARQPPETGDDRENESQPVCVFPEENKKVPAIAEAPVHPTGLQPIVFARVLTSQTRWSRKGDKMGRQRWKLVWLDWRNQSLASLRS